MTTGVLFVNTGTPDAPERAAVKHYLLRFLSDKRIVKLPAIIWQPLLRAFILNIRPAKTIEIYKKIWTSDGSPYTIHSLALESKLKAALYDVCGTAVVGAMAHNYGNPSVGAQLAQFKQQGVSELIVLPLYPQTAFSTTFAVHDELERALRKLDWYPRYDFIWEYYSNPQWVEAVAASIAQELSGLPQNTAVLFSYHSIPFRDTRNGDKYVQQVEESTAAISAKLDQNLRCEHAYQSSFDDAQRWQGPFIDATLAQLKQDGIKDVLIVTPGFAIDCTETLYDLTIKEQLANPNLNIHLTPCLNASDSHVKALISQISQTAQAAQIVQAAQAVR